MLAVRLVTKMHFWHGEVLSFKASCKNAVLLEASFKNALLLIILGYLQKCTSGSELLAVRLVPKMHFCYRLVPKMHFCYKLVPKNS